MASRGDAARRCEASAVSTPPKEMARERCLRPSVSAPDLVTVKDFFRFYIATSRPHSTDVPTADPINAVAEWFFARFTRITGTDTNEQERGVVYNAR